MQVDAGAFFDFAYGFFAVFGIAQSRRSESCYVFYIE